MRKFPFFFPTFPTRLLPYILPAACAMSLVLFSCAQQGSLTGGPKDEKPPEVVSSVPPNYSTRFRSDRIEVTFNEYIELKDVAKQLVISPPMVKKPEIKTRGKLLDIIFKDSLKPDLTYALNFGNALVDLNEGNAFKNFQFVFSTGNTIDSLQVGGRVVQAIDNKPAEDILVMLYRGNADSLPLKTIPLCISRTDKEGKFLLRNLAGGPYKIFALKDGNSNYLFDQPAEAVAFLDSLINPTVALAPVADSIRPPADSLKPARDTLIQLKDSVNPKKTRVAKDTLPPKPKYIFGPDNIELRLFTEIRPNQYIAGTDRLRQDQIRIRFNEKIDSLGFEFMDLPMDSVAVALEWSGDPDTVDFWIMNKNLAAHDSLKAIFVYPAYDSLERHKIKTDTVKLRFRQVPKPGAKPKNEFTVSVSVEKSKTLEFGQQLNFTTSLPYISMDTSLIRLVSGKDSTARRVPYKMIPDTIKGLIMNGLPINQIHPRIIRLEAGFKADTAYRLRLFPGAFTGIAGQKNDSLDVRFKMKSRDQYGSVNIILPDLHGSAIVELVDERNKVAATRMADGPGTVVFDLVSPGKYTARLIFDTNRNGRWDTGRYIRHIQPEKVINFSKELNLKANWDLTETWKWEDL